MAFDEETVEREPHSFLLTALMHQSDGGVHRDEISRARRIGAGKRVNCKLREFWDILDLRKDDKGNIDRESGPHPLV